MWLQDHALNLSPSYMDSRGGQCAGTKYNTVECWSRAPSHFSLHLHVGHTIIRLHACLSGIATPQYVCTWTQEEYIVETLFIIKPTALAVIIIQSPTGQVVNHVIVFW